MQTCKCSLEIRIWLAQSLRGKKKNVCPSRGEGSSFNQGYALKINQHEIKIHYLTSYLATQHIVGTWEMTIDIKMISSQKQE